MSLEYQNPENFLRATDSDSVLLSRVEESEFCENRYFFFLTRVCLLEEERSLSTGSLVLSEVSKWYSFHSNKISFDVLLALLRRCF